MLASIALVIGSMWSEQTTPLQADELRFQLRVVQGQIRLQEGHQMLATENGTEPPPWPEHNEQLQIIEEIAGSELVDEKTPSVQRTAAALWLLLKLKPASLVAPSDTDATDSTAAEPTRLTSGGRRHRPSLSEDDQQRFTTLLGAVSESDPLAPTLQRLARGEPIDRDQLNAAGLTPWLRGRLLIQSRFPHGPLQVQSNFLNVERPYLNRAVMLQTIMALLALSGLVLILALVVTRPKPVRLLDLTPPWQNDWWLAWYVPVGWFLSYQAFSLSILELSRLIGIPTEYTVGMQLIAQALSWLLVVHFLTRITPGANSFKGALYRLKLGLAAIDGRVSHAIGYALATVAIASPIVILATQLTELLPVLPREHTAILHILETTADSRSSWAEISLLLTVTVGAPLCEETIFRGFMFRHIRARFGVTVGATLSALAFACVHGSLASLIPLFALGILLALVVEWSGGVLPAILAHGLWNLSQLLVPLVILAP